MNGKIVALAGVAVAFALGACGGDAGYVSASVGGPIYDDGFYDGYYGPFYDGYWGGDGFFYYSGGRDRPFLRDEAHHFRREGAQGFRAFHHRHIAHPGEPGRG